MDKSLETLEEKALAFSKVDGDLETTNKSKPLWQRDFKIEPPISPKPIIPILDTLCIEKFYHKNISGHFIKNVPKH
jgi:hypothetical protein